MQREHQITVEIYARENQLMLSAVHELGQKRAMDHLTNQRQAQRPQPSSWLGLQRQQFAPTVVCTKRMDWFPMADSSLRVTPATPLTTGRYQHSTLLLHPCISDL